jgi:hypothetical protein
MPYINLPPTVSEMFWDLDRRIRALETAYRFNFPNVDFNTSTPTNPNVGDAFYDTYNNQLKYWNGTEWVVIADDNLGVPVVQYTPTWAGTGLTFTGTPAVGRYSRVGKMITYNIQVNCSTVTNFGTGQYSLTLPTGLNSGYSFQHLGGLHKNSNHYTLLGDLGAASNLIELYHPTANGGQDVFTHNKPVTLTTAERWYIAGTYFIA